MAFPTLGELARRLDERFSDLRDDIKNLADVVDKRVSTERYLFENGARDERERLLAERVKALEQANTAAADQRQREQQEKDKQRAADRRLIFTGLVVPVLLVLLQVWLAAKGAAK